jgi:hypothetical protein
MEYCREVLGPLLGPSILLRRGKNVPPETFIYSPWSSLVQCKASTSTSTNTSTGTHLLQYSPSLSDLYQTSRRLDHHQHSLAIWQSDTQIKSTIGHVSARIKPNPQSPVSPLKLVPASILQPTFGLTFNRRLRFPTTPHVSSTPTPKQAQARVRQGREREEKELCLAASKKLINFHS